MRRTVRSNAARRLSAEPLEPRLVLDAQFIITEFLAANSSVLADEDGDYSDWIEIRNNGPDEGSLDGWHLTDRPSNLALWRLPNLRLEPGEHLVVFASNKDRAVVGEPLHTNFALSADGEYLALVRPDGTIATEFAPQFPSQRTDISYGVQEELDITPLIGEGDSFKWFVPTQADDAAIGSTWTRPTFDDTAWSEGVGPLGYDRSGRDDATLAEIYRDAVLADEPIGYWRLGEAAGASAALDASGHGRHLTYNGFDASAYGRDGIFDDGSDGALRFFDPKPDDVLTRPNSSDFGFAVGQSFSIEFWINVGPGHASTNGAGIITKNYDTLQVTPWYLSRLLTDGRVDFYLRNVAGSNHVVTSSSTIDDGRWHHVVGVYDAAAAQVRLYVDGRLEATTGSVPQAAYGTGARPLTIGNHLGRRLDVTLDEVAIYAHALPADRIAQRHDFASGTAVASLRVDFGSSTDTGGGPGGRQPGFLDWEGSEQGGTSELVRSVPSSLGAAGEVGLSIAGYTHFRDYPAVTGAHAAYSRLLSDMVLRNSFGTLSLTFFDLRPGTYELTTHHHSTSFGGGMMEVRVSDSLGLKQLVSAAHPVSSGTSPSQASSLRIVFVSDGSAVRIDFAGGSGSEHVSINGFELGILARTSTVLAVDFNSRGAPQTADPTVTQSGFNEFLLNGAAGSAVTAPTTRPFGPYSVTVASATSQTMDDRRRSTPVDAGNFTESRLLRDGIFFSGATPADGAVVTIDGLHPAREYLVTLWSFDTGSSGNRVADWYAGGRLVTAGYTFNGADGSPASNDAYAFSFLTTADASGQLILSGRYNSASAAVPAVWLNALAVSEVLSGLDVGFSRIIETDLAAGMHEVNSSVYLRRAFEVGDPMAIDRLVMRVKYDDGFVAYLNGEPIVARSAPSSPAWNSAATAARANRDAIVFQQFDLSAYRHLLVAGQNVLAVHGLNVAADDEDFLISVELDAVRILGTFLEYFREPTPGADNVGGFNGFVDDPRFSVERGIFDAAGDAFALELSVQTEGAQIVYTLDGSAPEVANDGAILRGQLYINPIWIDKTTPVRAMAFKPDFEPSHVETHTYLFLNDIVKRSGVPAGYPSTWGTHSAFPGGQVIGYYGMNQNPSDLPLIAGDPNYTVDEAYAIIKQSLLALPTMSLVLDVDHIFGAQSGIYSNTQGGGRAWERPTSVELLNPDGSTGFAVDAGIRIQGFTSRDAGRNPKHSMRLVFRQDYGPGTLRHPFFGPDAADRFNTLVLRSNSQDAWVYNTYSNRNIGQFIRDMWMLETQRAMGQPATHARFVHLYINGIYWGVYNPTERPDAAFAQSYVGGEREDYDVLKNHEEVIDGGGTAYRELLALIQNNPNNFNAGYRDLSSDAAYQQVLAYVDPVNLADYMIFNMYAAVTDWPGNNYILRNRVTGQGFMFFHWDGEHAFKTGVTTDRTLPHSRDHDSPTKFHHAMKANAEYRMQFADRLHRAFFNGGPLYVDQANPQWDPNFPDRNVPAARWMEIAETLDFALIAESARWGNYRRDIHRYSEGPYELFTPHNQLLAERQRLLTQWFPQRSGIVLQQFRQQNLYPSVDAPVFHIGGTYQHGGHVPHGAAFSIAAPSGTIYYTLDGSDPRLPGDTVSPTALTYSTEVSLLTSGIVKARVLSGGGQWSALNEASYTIELPLRITEIHYNPPGSGDVAEFIEVMNVGAYPMNLAGIEFTQGVRFTFDELYLLAGERAVVVLDMDAFKAAYPRVPDSQIAGQFEGRLDNSGETITLADRLGNVIQSFRYEPSWYPETNDQGRSLVIVDSTRPVESWANGRAWRASFALGGSPGAEDRMVGDLVGNNFVGLVDVLTLRNHLGQSSSTLTPADGDLNEDGTIDRADVAIMAGTYGMRYVPPELNPSLVVSQIGLESIEDFNDFRGTFATVPAWFDSQQSPLLFVGVDDGASVSPGFRAYAQPGSDDYSFGILETGGVGDSRLLLPITNGTDLPIDRIEIAYEVEQWLDRSDTRQNRIRLKYSWNPNGFSEADDLVSTGAPINTGAGPLNGKLPENRVAVHYTIELDRLMLPGETVYIRWQYSNAEGEQSGPRDGLAIDNLRVTALSPVSPSPDAPAASATVPAVSTVFTTRQALLPPLRSESETKRDARVFRLQRAARRLGDVVDRLAIDVARFGEQIFAPRAMHVLDRLRSARSAAGRLTDAAAVLPEDERTERH